MLKDFFIIFGGIINTKYKENALLLIEQRKMDIVRLIKNLDLPHSLYENAVEKYEALGKLLNDNGLECDIYPQGSFATGTVVRPIKNGENANYDLDTVVVVHQDKAYTSAENIKKTVGDIIAECKRYRKSPTEYDTCWTIEFANENDIGFNIDVVPCVLEDDSTLTRLKAKSLPQTRLYVEQSIAITKKTTQTTYEWSTNNPLGFKEWFDEINKPFLKFSRDQRKIMFETRAAVAEIEEIPSDEERSSIQIAIQILKRHRDVYFSRINSNLKPISAIITTLAATVAKKADVSLHPVDLLAFIIEEITSYAGLDIYFESTGEYEQRSLILKHRGAWILNNPVNPEDNLLDSWNQSNGAQKAKAFFDWIKAIKENFMGAFSLNDDFRFFSAMCESFGNDFVNQSEIRQRYCPPPKPVYPTKPWRRT